MSGFPGAADPLPQQVSDSLNRIVEHRARMQREMEENQIKRAMAAVMFILDVDEVRMPQYMPSAINHEAYDFIITADPPEIIVRRKAWPHPASSDEAGRANKDDTR